MTIDEQVRHDLFAGLQAAVGAEPAKLMMTAIPPFSWSEIATKADLAQFATRNEMLASHNEMKLEFSAVRGEMHADSASIRDEMHTGFAAIRLEMANSTIGMMTQIGKLQWNLMFQIATINISTAGIVIAALHFLR